MKFPDLAWSAGLHAISLLASSAPVEVISFEPVQEPD